MKAVFLALLTVFAMGCGYGSKTCQVPVDNLLQPFKL
jgi:hypothetical protein